MNNIIGGNVIGSVIGGSGPNSVQIGHGLTNPIENKKNQAKDDVDVLSFFADTSGCAHYRLFWPESILRSRREYSFQYLKKPMPDPRWYEGTDIIRIQRQVSDKQLKLAQFLRQVTQKFGSRLIYEIDDLPLYKYIPDYNQHKEAYKNPIYAKSVVDIINCCDEVTTTTKTLRDILKEETGHDNITVIPNFVPHLWMGGYYNEDIISKNYKKNKNRPRILYAGSGAHYSSDGKIPDDFSALVDLVRKTHKEFTWVFYGGFPRQLVDLLQRGKVEYHKWVDTMRYPDYFDTLKVNVSIAPLIDNVFNRCKSDIKFTESCAYGIPSVCQDMVTYENAINKFNSPDDLYDQLKRITQDAGVYMKESRKSYQYITKTGWMEDNIKYWETLFKTPPNHKERELLTKFQ